MTESDFFRIARERLGTYGLVVWRDVSNIVQPYKVSLSHDGKEYEQHGNTLAACLEQLLARIGVDRRTPPAPQNDTPRNPEDAKWPGG